MLINPLINHFSQYLITGLISYSSTRPMTARHPHKHVSYATFERTPLTLVHYPPTHYSSTSPTLAQIARCFSNSYGICSERSHKNTCGKKFLERQFGQIFSGRLLLTV